MNQVIYTTALIFYDTKLNALIPFVSAENWKIPISTENPANPRVSYIGMKLSKDLQKVPHVHKLPLHSVGRSKERGAFVCMHFL